MDEEDTPPPLPKRPPTIIRAAPPVPSTTNSANQNGPKANQPLPSRPVPPRPVPKVPSPTPSSGNSKESKSHPSSGKAGPNGSRRKLEITIVDARPMSEMGFRDIKSMPATENQAKSAVSSAQYKTDPSNNQQETGKGKTDHKDEPLPPLRPSRPGAAPCLSPQASSVATPHPEVKTSGKESSSSSRSIKDGDRDSNEGKAEVDDEPPPKPKRPTIIRPPSKLLKQQAITSVDMEPGLEEKKSPPPLPSVLPSQVPKVPPLPSRLPVAPASTQQAALVSRPLPPTPDETQSKPPPVPSRPPPESEAPPVSRPPLPKPESQPQPLASRPPPPKPESQIQPQPVSRPPPPKPKSPPVSRPPPPKLESQPQPQPRPKPRPRPRSTIVVSNSTLSESLSLGENPNTNSIDQTSFPTPTSVLEPQRPRKPTIIRPKSMMLPQSSQLVFPNNSSSSQDTSPSNPSPLVPTRPQPPLPSGQRKQPPRPAGPPVKSPSASSSTSDVIQENEYRTIGDVHQHQQDQESNVHLRKNAGKTQALFKQDLKPSSSTSPGSLSNEEPEYCQINKPKSNSENVPLVNAAQYPESAPLEEIPPVVPPKSDIKPQPDAKPMPKPKPKPKPKAKPSPGSNTNPSPHNHGETSQAMHEGPHHISSAFLSKFEPKENNSNPVDRFGGDLKSGAKGDGKEKDVIEVNKEHSVFTAKTDGPPIPPKRSRSEDKEETARTREVRNKESPSAEVVSSPVASGDNARPRSAPKRPVTIIGFPQRASKNTDSTDKEEEDVSPEKNMPSRPSRPPEKSRPPPPVITSLPVSKPRLQELPVGPEGGHGTDVDSTQHRPNAAMDGSLRVVKEPGIVDLNQNVTKTQKEQEQKEATSLPARPPPSRPSGPPRPTPPVSVVKEVDGPACPRSDDFAEKEEKGRIVETRESEKREVEDVSVGETIENKKMEIGDVKEAVKEAPKDGAMAEVRGPGRRPPRPVSAVPTRTRDDSHKDTAPPSHKPHTSVSHVSLPDRPKPPRPQSMISPTTASSSSVSKPKPSGPPSLPPRPAPGHALYHYLANQPHGIASHDYAARQDDELSFKAGEVVLVTKEVDDDWLCGRVGYEEGIFPKAFVSLQYNTDRQQSAQFDEEAGTGGGPLTSGMVDDVQEVDVLKPDHLTGPRCRARFDFEGEGEGELAIEDGDVIRLISHMGTEWMKGELNGKVGIFPSPFVEIIEDVGSEETVDIGSSQASALFDFEGQDGELSFQAGDKIDIISQVNSEWLYGECGGKAGKFPTTFVSHIPVSLPQHTDDSKAGNGDVGWGGGSAGDEAKEVTNLAGRDDVGRKAAIGYCTALHDYTVDTPGDLRFESGDRVEVLEFVGEDWLQGRCHGQEGLFPATFVVMDTRDGDGEEDGRKGEEEGRMMDSKVEQSEPLCAVALHDFEGETETDLTFKKGDVIELHEFVDASEEWRWGTFQARRGMFPAAFVQV